MMKFLKLKNKVGLKIFNFEKELEKYNLTPDTFEKMLDDCSKKVQNVSDMEWQDILKKYNVDLHYDTLRKSQQPSPFGGAFIREYYIDKMSNQNNEDSYLSSLQAERRELAKERYKLQATKLELQRDLRQESRFELFYENIANTIEALPLPIFQQYKPSYSNKEYVVGLGDIHYGANFVSQNNSYSREECKRRFEVLLSELIDYVTCNNINKLKIVNVADTIQGILRLSDLQINDIAVVECVVEISRIIGIFLNELSAYCNIEYYHICNANHSQTRNLGSKASELATEDMEKIIVNYIADLVSNNPHINVIFDTNKEYMDFNIFDYECISEHGHRVKNLNSYLQDKSILHRKIYTYGFVGHTHSSQEIIVGETDKSNMTLFVIPSFVGSDPYSNTLNAGSKAMVKIFEFDEQHGHIGSKNIILN